MADGESIVKEALEEGEAMSAEEEFDALYVDSQQATFRLAELAKKAEAEGHPEVAKVYREVSGTVMSLITDMIATSGAVVGELEERLDGGTTESVLLPEDADRYLAYFGQVTRLFSDLRASAESSGASEQVAVLDALLRMTADLASLTTEIRAEADEPDAEGDAGVEDDDEDE